jgi:ring-1,2-phenylacetyl-CoA epoxidase subunit PaaD
VSAAREMRAAVGAVPDPEIPVLTVDDLGIVRDIQIDGERVLVKITPTYSGCPALDPISREVERTVRAHGYAEVEVRTVLAPAWSTDWISEEGRHKLQAYGIAPPAPSRDAGCPLADLAVRCPRCGSSETRQISRFGATPCQAHFVCRACAEPFDHFKTLA